MPRLDSCSVGFFQQFVHGEDEYETEADTITSLLLNSGSVSRDQMDGIWREWFQVPLSEVIGIAK